VRTPSSRGSRGARAKAKKTQEMGACVRIAFEQTHLLPCVLAGAPVEGQGVAGADHVSSVAVPGAIHVGLGQECNNGAARGLGCELSAAAAGQRARPQNRCHDGHRDEDRARRVPSLQASGARYLEAPGWRPFPLQDVEADLPRLEVDIRMEDLQFAQVEHAAQAS